jgi:hypothetical protein
LRHPGAARVEEASVSGSPANAATLRQSQPTTASTRKTAVLVGLLFLIATVTFATADALIKGVLKGSNYLTGVSAHTNALAAGALLAFVQGIAIVAIALLLFPLFRRTSEPLALAYVGFRVAELAATLFYVVTPLLVINVGNAFGNATLSTSASQHLGALFQGQRTVSIEVLYLVTSVDGSILAFLLYRSRLVPRPIAILGLVGYPVLALGTILAMFNVTTVTHGVGLVALVPGGLFELILPIWLIVKGFAFPGSQPVMADTAGGPS